MYPYHVPVTRDHPTSPTAYSHCTYDTSGTDNRARSKAPSSSTVVLVDMHGFFLTLFCNYSYKFPKQIDRAVTWGVHRQTQTKTPKSIRDQLSYSANNSNWPPIGGSWRCPVHSILLKSRNDKKRTGDRWDENPQRFGWPRTAPLSPPPNSRG